MHHGRVREPDRAFEVKFDGVRAIGYSGPSGLTLYSRNHRDISRSYPEIAALELEEGVIVDLGSAADLR